MLEVLGSIPASGKENVGVEHAFLFAGMTLDKCIILRHRTLTVQA